MHKYNIEEEIDFYKELNEEDKFLDKDVCLITKEPLLENFVKFSCKHTFNYVAIFNEVFKQKYSKASFYNNNKLMIKFVCPYCREPQNKLLPYYPEYNFQQIQGINSDKSNYAMVLDQYNNLVYADTVVYFKGICSFTKDEICCQNNYVVRHKPTNKTYCYTHIKQIKKQLINEEKLTQKMELKAKADLEKKKIAEEKKKIAEEKKKISEEKKKIAEEKKKDIPTCVQLLKSGKNKGITCGCKAFNDNLCKKHGYIEKI